MVIEKRYWNRRKSMFDLSVGRSRRLHWIEPGDETGERIRTAQPSDIRAVAEYRLTKWDVNNTRIAALQRCRQSTRELAFEALTVMVPSVTVAAARVMYQHKVATDGEPKPREEGTVAEIQVIEMEVVKAHRVESQRAGHRSTRRQK